MDDIKRQLDAFVKKGEEANVKFQRTVDKLDLPAAYLLGATMFLLNRILKEVPEEAMPAIISDLLRMIEFYRNKFTSKSPQSPSKD